MTQFLQVSLALAGTMFSAPLACGQVVTDGEWLPTTWSTTTLIATGTSYVTAGRHAQGGRPGANYSIDHFIEGGGHQGLVVFHGYSPFAFDPARSGALLSLDFSLDAEANDPAYGTSHGFAFAVQQGEDVYVAPLTVVGSYLGWRTITATNLSLTDFDRVNPSAGLRGWVQTQVHPSPSAQCTFGFVTYNSANLGIGIRVDYDNWNLALRPTGSFATDGQGCPPAQPPMLGLSTVPRISSTQTVSASSLPLDVGLAVLLLGGSRTFLPLDAIGAAGCSILVSDLFASPTMTLVGTTAAIDLDIPGDPILVGFSFHLQAAALSATSNQLGLSMTDRGTIVIGG